MQNSSYSNACYNTSVSRDSDRTYAEAIQACGSAVDPRDDSVWIAESDNPGRLVHLAANGRIVFETQTPGFFSNSLHQIAIDPRDGAIWYAGFHSGYLFKRSAEGQLLTTIAGFDRPVSVAINPRNGDVWVADFSVTTSGTVVKLSSSGTVLLRVHLEKPPRIIAISPVDETVWVGIDGAMVQLADTGAIIQKVTGFTNPQSIAFVSGADDIVTWLRHAKTCLGSQ